MAHKCRWLFVQDCTCKLHQFHWFFVAFSMWIEHVELQQEHCTEIFIIIQYWNYSIKFNWTHLFRFKFKVNPKYELRTFAIPLLISGSWKTKFGFGDKLNALLASICNNNTITAAKTNNELRPIIFHQHYVVLNFAQQKSKFIWRFRMSLILFLFLDKMCFHSRHGNMSSHLMFYCFISNV